MMSSAAAARWVRRVAALGVFGTGAAWVADSTINDDWPEFRSNFRQRFSGTEDQRPRIVVVGSGWAACSFLRSIHEDKFRITVVSPRNYFLFTPLLAGTTVGTTEPRSIITPIRSMLGGDVSYLQAQCDSVDVERKCIKCCDVSPTTGNLESFELEYDQLVVACGAQPATFNIPGIEENAHFMKELPDSLAIRDRPVLSFIPMYPHACGISAENRAFPRNNHSTVGRP